VRRICRERSTCQAPGRQAGRGEVKGADRKVGALLFWHPGVWVRRPGTLVAPVTLLFAPARSCHAARSWSLLSRCSLLVAPVTLLAPGRSCHAARSCSLLVALIIRYAAGLLITAGRGGYEAEKDGETGSFGYKKTQLAQSQLGHFMKIFFIEPNC